MSRTATNRRQALMDTAQEFRIQLIYLFGSQVEPGMAYIRGEDVRISDPLSDLDIGIRLEDPDDFTALERINFYSDLSNRLQDLFTPFDLDLVLLDETHSVFQAEAISGACVYAVSEGVQSDYEIRVLARAADFRPVLEMFYRERLEDL